MLKTSAPSIATPPQRYSPELWFKSFNGSLRRVQGLSALAVAAFLVLEIKDAWLSDDAYITFRTVYNFTHGYGLVWNVGERVQSYTHPLWMFLLTIAYALGHD